MCTQKHSASVNRAFGEHWQALSSIVPWSFVFCVCVCVHEESWECTFWPGYVCRRAIRPGAQNQSAEPAGSGQICNLCVRVLTYTDGSRAVVAHIQVRAHTHTQWVKHIMHMMQTNKQESRFYFSVSLCNPTLLLPRTHMHTYLLCSETGWLFIFQVISEGNVHKSWSQAPWFRINVPALSSLQRQ